MSTQTQNQLSIDFPSRKGVVWFTCSECRKRRPGRPDARYCSPSCRIKASKKRRGLVGESKKKERGKRLAAESHAAELETARCAAYVVARADGTADIERVREYLESRGIQLVWGNWAGSVFAGKEWEPTGQYVEVRHPGGRRRGGGVRVWRLRR